MFMSMQSSDPLTHVPRTSHRDRQPCPVFHLSSSAKSKFLWDGVLSYPFMGRLLGHPFSDIMDGPLMFRARPRGGITKDYSLGVFHIGKLYNGRDDLKLPLLANAAMHPF